MNNVFIIGKEKKSEVTLPKGKGIRRTILAEFEAKQQKAAQTKA